MKKNELICTCCPLGCMLTVMAQREGEISVTGNSCPRGVTYAISEMTDPRRIVTSTVRVLRSNTPTVSVKTKEAIPKNKILQCIKELAAVELQAPVLAGDIVKANIAGTGIDVVATKNIA